MSWIDHLIKERDDALAQLAVAQRERDEVKERVGELMEDFEIHNKQLQGMMDEMEALRARLAAIPSGYVRNCYIDMEGVEPDEWLFQHPAGTDICVARLKGFAIVPREKYEQMLAREEGK